MIWHTSIQCILIHIIIYKYHISENQHNCLSLSFLFFNYFLVVTLCMYIAMFSHSCLFLPLQYRKMNNITCTTHIYTFIYKKSTYSRKSIYSWNYIFIHKFLTCVTNTHSMLKYCPMTIDDMLLAKFYAGKLHSTKYAFYICWHFCMEPLLVLYFSSLS